MTMKSIPITVCFGVITVFQFAVGASAAILTIKEGGEAKSYDHKSRSHSEH